MVWESSSRQLFHPIPDLQRTVISSYTHAVEFGASPILIGERINPTGKKRFKQALLEKDMDYILGEGIKRRKRAFTYWM